MGPAGRLLRDGAGMRLEFVRSYAASVDDVWSALTRPDPMARWIGSWTGDPTTGTVEFTMAESPPGAERRCPGL